ncbi:SMC-Scp complex subunit ScpB [Aerococcus sp. 1KP-2016]|jgi:segregation and condensation protein B|uniref:SMC-Scp complex subunit ScpB n=1 Tax=Aerococcus sp. 1KP-2016 TaxID=1981982 RepID=UPI000B97E0C4|nr:SMC-Scp complex subunit ScpB [Aerococcus sp. 1KP-2016]OYQ67059.1 SMC-Scp complex subunit ScpB [Aerococcus sp. 1KP-2016]
MSAVGAIESLLFVAGEDGIAIDELANLLEIRQEWAFYYVMVLGQKLKNDDQAGLRLTVINERVQLVTKSEYGQIVKNYAVSPFATKLSQAALETLAIIAYQQPITRMAIDDIRGVQSSNMIHKLLERDLIMEQGRQNSPGRPIIYGVTNYFYQYFGLESLEDLPDIHNLVLDGSVNEETLFKIDENGEPEQKDFATKVETSKEEDLSEEA